MGMSDNRVVEDFNLIEAIYDRKNPEFDHTVELDVIIPVYNAYEDFVKCLQSTLRHQADYRVIVINDKSTDDRVNALFTLLSSIQSYGLIVLENSENLGFVKTVNKGMRYSHKDVILLNSDTIVTKGWASKLSQCARSNDKIATVTPFTNNGTICSIPNFCEDNLIPEGFIIDTFADFIESASLNKYPVIPTAVGFCMLIKRKIIDELGYFDEESYGKGYGEENDFCMRAVRKGYVNVLCDNTYIYHKQGASFLSMQHDCIDKNSKVLYEKYPEYLPAIRNFCDSKPLEILQDNYATRMKTWDTGHKKRILYVLHHRGGGTEINVNDIIECLSSDYMFYILQTVEDKIVLTEINNGERIRYTFKLSYTINPIAYTFINYQFFEAEYAKVLRHIFNTFRIDLIHVQHLIGHKLDIFTVAKEQNIPVITTIHDYYYVCPMIHLVDENNICCICDISLDKCKKCISRSMKLPEDFILDWRREFGNALNTCDQVVFPTKSVSDLLSRYYDIPAEKKVIIEHGLKIEATSDMDQYHFNDKFHIAFIGGLSQIKGREIFYKLARSNDLREKVKWSIIGISDIHSAPAYYQEDNIHIYGMYDGFNELRQIYENDRIDLVILPTICPETYSYTLSEAWALGVPAVVSNLGALKERVEKTGGGWIVDSLDYISFKLKILKILNSKEDYLKKKQAVKQITLKTTDEMAHDYMEIYNKLLHSSKPVNLQKFVLSNNDIYRSIEGREQYYKSEVAMQEQLNLIDRFVLCIRQNGYRYTIIRIVRFTRNKLFNKNK